MSEFLPTIVVMLLAPVALAVLGERFGWVGVLLVAYGAAGVLLGETLSDLAVGAAAMVGAWVALRGLRTWRDQLRGTTEYEQAQKLAYAALTFQHELYEFRNSAPAVLKKGFEEPWEKVRLALDDLRSAAAGADLIWESRTVKEAAFIMDCEATRVRGAATLFYVAADDFVTYGPVMKNYMEFMQSKEVLASDGKVRTEVERIQKFCRERMGLHE